MTAPIDTLRQGAADLGTALSDQQAEQLLAYGTLMLKWNKVYNLTALRDPASVLTHHLPGVVIAIMRPDLEVSCLDAVAKKAAFVQQVAAELDLPNLRGLHARVESLTGSYEVISSRAFASLPDFFNGSRHLLAPDGVWLAMKGKVPTDELAALPQGIAVFHVEQLTVPSLDAERCIVWARKEAA